MFWILNRGTEPLLVRGAGPPPPPLGFALPADEDLLVPSQNTLFYVPNTPVLALGLPSAKLLHVDDARAADLEVNLRILEITRQSPAAGTQIPAVHESAAPTKAIDLLGVQTNESFRALLRVYDFEPAAGHSVLVRFYLATASLTTAATDQLLSETTLTFQVPSDTFNYPGYAEMYVPIDVSPVRIEIVPLTEGLHFWAFASVTNKSTQQVALVTP